jgi:hypothetical protein
LIFDQAVFRRNDSITTSSRPEYAMFVFRLLRLIAHLFKGMAVCAFLFPFTSEQGRQAHIRRWSSKLLRICGIAIKIDDGKMGPQYHVAQQLLHNSGVLSETEATELEAYLRTEQKNFAGRTTGWLRVNTDIRCRF